MGSQRLVKKGEMGRRNYKGLKGHLKGWWWGRCLVYPIPAYLGSDPNSAPHSGFLLKHTLKGTSDGWSTWVPIMYKGDLGWIPHSWLCPFQPASCSHFRSELFMRHICFFISGFNEYVNILKIKSFEERWWKCVCLFSWLWRFHKSAHMNKLKCIKLYTSYTYS